jgi:hypothetical protein
MASKVLSKEQKKAFIADLLGRLLPAYDGNGNVVEDFYLNIVLPVLSSQELTWLREAAGGNF